MLIKEKYGTHFTFRALVGKKKGAQVEVVTPGGAKAYEVMKVEWR